MKKIKLLISIPLFTVIVSSYIYLLSFYLASPESVINSKPQPETSLRQATEKVSRVIDGDTFEIEGDIKVRLIGIDTPEMVNKNKTVDCFAQEAKEKLTKEILGKEVILVKDVSETDKYGRLLRYVFVGEEMINEKMVKEGFAKVSTFPPDVLYINKFLEGERSAKESSLGLWVKCK